MATDEIEAMSVAPTRAEVDAFWSEVRAVCERHPVMLEYLCVDLDRWRLGDVVSELLGMRDYIWQ